MSSKPTVASAPHAMREDAVAKVAAGAGLILSKIPTLESSLLRTLIDSVPDQVFARDRSHRHILNNHAQLKLLGVSTFEETFGKTDFDFYPAEMAANFHRDNEQVMATGNPMVDREEEIPSKAGGPIWLSTTKVPIRDEKGQIVGILGIARDITERKRSIEKILEQSAIIDQAHDAIVLLDLDNRVIYKNPAAERLFGYSMAQVMGKTAAEIFPKEFRAGFIEATRATYETGSWHGEIRLQRPDGSEVIIDNRRSLIRGPDGKPRGQLSISIDITEKRRVEGLSLRNQRLESIGTLAGGIAHDLNNVLAPILMSIALLRHKVSDEGGHRLLGMLEQNAERGAQLVRQVLAFGRGAEGERTLVQVRHIAREIEHIVADTFPKSVKLEFISETSPWTVVGDATQLHQVMLNLCVNARDAMPDGGVITMKLENRYLDETFASMNPGSKPGPYLAVTVSDTGAGMDAHVREHIFEPFFTTKDIGKGTGLGLSTSLGIVQSHGGFIHVTSAVGKGSSFVVYLPATMEQVIEPSTAERDLGLPRGHNELVLVVDDEEPILAVAKSTLERFGYRVLTANNGASAVSLYALHRETIAAVLTDVAMPIMDGPAMAVALKAINPMVPIIGSSGLDGNSRTSAGARPLFRDFIQKPYTADTLLRTITQALHHESPAEPASP